MSLTDRALWIIERNLGAPLSLAGLADACGVTRFHLAHAFSDVTDYSVMEYVRLRRLTESAKLLAGGADSILQVALASGYGSHEAFTRAFGAHFKVTPERYRTGGPPDPNALVEPLTIEARPDGRHPTVRVLQATAFDAVGLVETHDIGDVTRIPAQWRAFGPQIQAIPERIGPGPLGLMLDIENDGGSATPARCRCAVWTVHSPVCASCACRRRPTRYFLIGGTRRNFAGPTPPSSIDGCRPMARNWLRGQSWSGTIRASM